MSEEKFPKTVMICIDSPEGLPKVKCRGVLGIAYRSVGDYWITEFLDKNNEQRKAAFHKNSLKVIA